MTEWFETLPGLHGTMWEHLARGVADQHAPARHPTVATVSPDGRPEARTVVLRAADPVAGTLDIHTDLHSGKIASLRQTPLIALHVWEDRARLQIRLDASVAVLTGADAAAIWARVPDPSRQSYGVTPPPGTPIADALAYVKDARAETFAVLRCTVLSADLLHLGDMHRRARFGRADGWTGQWLAP